MLLRTTPFFLAIVLCSGCLRFNLERLDFGTVYQTVRPPKKSVLLLNDSEYPSTILKFTLPSSPFRVVSNPCPSQLLPAESCALELELETRHKGVFTSLLQVEFKTDKYVNSAVLNLSAELVSHPDPCAVFPFGKDGKVQHRFSGSEEQTLTPLALERQSTGKMILLASSRKISQQTDDALLYRFHCNGAIDESFRNGGFDDQIFSEPTGRINAFALFSDDSFLIYGSECGKSFCGYTLSRYDAEGNRDPGFINGASSFLEERLSSLAIHPEGKMFAAGKCPMSGRTKGCVARFLSTGELDSEFGQQGVLLLNLTDSPLEAFTHVLVDQENRVILAGYSSNYVSSRVFFIRLLPTGVMDFTFGNGGILEVFSPGVDHETISDIRIASDNALWFTTSRSSLQKFQTYRLAGPNTVSIPFSYPKGFAVSLDFQRGLLSFAGFFTTNDQSRVGIFKTTSLGEPDNDFGKNGLQKISVPFRTPKLLQRVQPNGEVVVAGVASDTPASEKAIDILRLDWAGDWDTEAWPSE